jgi:hypothetical protein
VRRTLRIVSVGALGSVASFVLFYLVGTASSRELIRQPSPELAWLKKEFQVGNAEHDRILLLHREYLPQCAQRCRVIEEQNASSSGSCLRVRR